MTTQCCYIGKGIVYGRINGAAVPALDFGNVSKLDLAIQQEEKTVKDYRSGGGGTACSVIRISNVGANITMNCLSPANLARALAGTASVIAAGSVAAASNPVVAFKGGFIPTAPGATAVVVTNAAASTTYVAGTDYSLTGGGIVVLTAGAIVDAQSIRVGYTNAALDAVDIITGAFGSYQLWLDGLNEMESGNPVLIEIYKFKFGPAAALAMISDDPAELAVTGKLEADTSKTGAGVSQYMKVKIKQ